jgi:heme exporter protein CcmD
MDWSAHNAGFVIAAYAITAISLLALVAAVLMADARNAKAVKNLKD